MGLKWNYSLEMSRPKAVFFNQSVITKALFLVENKFEI